MAQLVLEEYLPSALPQRWAHLVGQEGLDLLAEIGAAIDRNPGQKALLTPLPQQILRAFEVAPTSVRVLLVGQDPYPGAGHAMGLAFSVDASVSSLPPSLRNIRAELESDVGVRAPAHGDLSAWSTSGVFLLNRHLTSLVGASGAHRGLGWSRFTDLVVTRLVARGHRFVAILWGREAQELSAVLGETPRVLSAHPSPLSARAGFFGSAPFSRANALLDIQGQVPLDWSLDRVG